jgi:hypothetical protein
MRFPPGFDDRDKKAAILAPHHRGRHSICDDSEASMPSLAARLKKTFSPKLDDSGAVFATALFFLFAFFLICAGMWVVAAQTGFVGAVGHLRKAHARAPRLA